MNRLKTLLAFAFCCTMICSAKAQDELTEALKKDSKKDTKVYALRSLEGKNVAIHIMPHYDEHVLKISCLTDTITNNDYWGVPVDVTYLSRSFLQIKYEVRGGSNFGLGNTLLLCVSGNRLYEALHILRYTDWDSGNLIKKYNVRLSVTSYKKPYVLKAKISDKSISTDEPESNYQYTDQTALQFDGKLKVFYSVKENLYDTLNVCYPNLSYKREIQGNFPKVLLGNEQYVFIGGQWFEIDTDTLTKY